MEIALSILIDRSAKVGPFEQLYSYQVKNWVLRLTFSMNHVEHELSVERGIVLGANCFADSMGFSIWVDIACVVAVGGRSVPLLNFNSCVS